MEKSEKIAMEQLRVLGGIQAALSTIMTIQARMLAQLANEPVEEVLEHYNKVFNANAEAIEQSVNEGLGLIKSKTNKPQTWTA